MKKQLSDKNFYTRHTAGFTLVETLVAVLLLALCVSALLELAANGFFSVRYAKNEIIANSLMQESLEYIRNSRDTEFQNGVDWQTWLGEFNVDENGIVIAPAQPGEYQSGCFSNNGCYVDPLSMYQPHLNSIYVYAIENGAPYIKNGIPYIYYFPTQQFYGYTPNSGRYWFIPDAAAYATNFQIKITMQLVPANASGEPAEVEVTGTAYWLNGNEDEKITQSIIISNWTTD